MRIHSSLESKDTYVSSSFCFQLTISCFSTIKQQVYNDQRAAVYFIAIYINDIRFIIYFYRYVLPITNIYILYTCTCIYGIYCLTWNYWKIERVTRDDIFVYVLLLRFFLF